MRRLLIVLVVALGVVGAMSLLGSDESDTGFVDEGSEADGPVLLTRTWPNELGPERVMSTSPPSWWFHPSRSTSGTTRRSTVPGSRNGPNGSSPADG